MHKVFIIHDRPNKEGFERYCITQDNGKPYLENTEPISTNDPGDLFKALAEWVEEGNK